LLFCILTQSQHSAESERNLSQIPLKNKGDQSHLEYILVIGT
jgi:hypothetical protein